MRKPWEYTLLLVVLTSACSPSEDAILAAIEQTQAEWTPIPTQSPYPTYTPYPTPTTAPPVTQTPPPASSEILPTELSLNLNSITT